MNLSPYYNRLYGSQARYVNVPISLLDEAKRTLKNIGLKYRIRYRGPRNLVWDRRPKSTRKQDCLKRFANRFSVYLV